jgi:hypothetical protein
MKKTAILIFSAVSASFALTAPVASAESSSVHSEVHSSTIYNSNTNMQSTSHSKVTVTCNGQTYTYESEGDDIHANPCEGSKVDISNNGTTSTNITPVPTWSKEQIDQKKADVKKKIDEEKAKIKATITAIPKPEVKSAVKFDLGAWIRSFFASFFSK